MMMMMMMMMMYKSRNRRYPTETITDANYADGIAPLANTPIQVESLLRSLEQAAEGIGLYLNADKTEYTCFNLKGAISTLNGSSLTLVNKFTYLDRNVSSTENVINMCLAKAWTAVDRLSIIWKSDLYDKLKRNLSQAAVVSILRYGCTICMLIKRIEKKLDRKFTKMLPAILNNSRQQHLTKQLLYGHLPLISKTIQRR